MHGRQFVETLMLVSLAAVSLGASRSEVPLIESVKNGDLPAVRALAPNTDVNVAEADGTTALHWASHLNQPEIVDLLLREGADFDAVNRYGVTPLWLACVDGEVSVIQRLLRAGADPNTRMAAGDTVLMRAARAGNLGTVKLLLSAGAAVNAREHRQGQTALMWAAAENRPEVVEALIKEGADLSARSTGQGGFTALLFGVRQGNLDAVRELLDAGASPNETLPEGTSAVGLAVASAHYELGALLLERGADPNAAGSGWTALHRVTWSRRPYKGTNNPVPVPTGEMDSLTFVERLLAHGAEPNALLQRPPAVLFVGRDVGRRGGAHLLGATPFFLAARNADVPLMRLLVEHGADPLRPNVDQTTPLMAAAGVGIWAPGENPGTAEEATEAVALCLELGGDPTKVDVNGETALHGAALRGSNGAVRLLVDAGARLDVREKNGWTPWRIAEGVVTNITVKRAPETAALLRELMEARGLTITDTRDLVGLSTSEKSSP